MRPSRRKLLRVFFAAGAVLAVVWLSGVRLFAFPGESMSPTVMPGDCFVGLVGLWHLRTPQRFDLLVYDVPPTSQWAARRIPWMKRVVGLPGERIWLAGTDVFIDGRKLEVTFLHRDPAARPTAEIERKLGPDEYFLLGDNLDHSFDDSRTMGPIPRALVRGFVAWVIPTSARRRAPDHTERH